MVRVMSSPEATTLTLAATKDEALQAILDALPKDAIVREEEDGIGRFAGVRVVAMIARGRKELVLSEGGQGELKPMLDKSPMEGHVNVGFEPKGDGVVVTLKRRPDKPKGMGGHFSDFVSQGVTVAALVVGYHWFQDMVVDPTLVAGISVGGAVVWSAIAYFIPQKPKPGLDDLVKEALKPLKPKSKKKKAKPKDDEAEA